MTDPLLVIDRNGPVVTLTLNRPQALNALSLDLISILTQTLGDLATDETVRAIVLTGAGRAFCCGVDLKELSETPGALDRMRVQVAGNLFDVARASPHPIICAVNGYAVTGGLELAMMADFILAAPEAKFADTHARVGITPSWGMTQVLPRLIGINRARQMSLTGEFIDAKTARDWGLVSEVVPEGQLLARAQALATQIAETERSTMIRIRGLIGKSVDLSLTDGMALETEMFDTHIRTVSTDSVAQNRAIVTARGRVAVGDAKTD